MSGCCGVLTCCIWAKGGPSFLTLAVRSPRTPHSPVLLATPAARVCVHTCRTVWLHVLPHLRRLTPLCLATALLLCLCVSSAALALPNLARTRARSSNRIPSDMFETPPLQADESFRLLAIHEHTQWMSFCRHARGMPAQRA